MDTPSSRKKSLRQEFKKKRASLSPSYRDQAALALPSHSMPFLGGDHSERIGFYMPKGQELDPRPLVKALSLRGHSLCLPVVSPGSRLMKFLAYSWGDRLESGAFDILQPVEGQDRMIPDIIFLPLLAADLTGNRLGYGGGYYDCTLTQLQKQKGVLAIGLCFEWQIIEEVPGDKHDTRLDWLMSEKRVIEL